MWLVLVSCGGWDEPDSWSAQNNGEQKKWLEVFSGEQFSIAVPAAWSTIEDTSVLLPKPHNGAIELASRSDDVQNGFSNNLLILSQPLSKSSSSKDFSLLNHVWVSREYSEYIELDSKQIEFSSKDSSQLYIFEAKYNIDTPKLKFIQTAAVCSKTWYLLTIALPVSVKDTTKYEQILSTFSCK